MDSKDFKKIWPIKQEMNMATDSDDMSTTYESELSSDEYGDFRIPKLEIKKEIGSDDDSYPMWTRTSTNIPLKFPGRYYDKSSWTRREKKVLLGALELYGFSNIKKVAEAVKTKDEHAIMLIISQLTKRANARIYNRRRDPSEPDYSDLYGNRAPPVVEWKKTATTQMRTISKRVAHDTVLLDVVRKCYEEAGDFGNVPYKPNFKAVYKFILDCMGGEAPSLLKPLDAGLLLEVMSDLKAFTQEANLENEYMWISKFKGCVTLVPPSMIKVENDTKDNIRIAVPEKMFELASKHFKVKECLNPLGVPPFLLFEEQAKVKKFYKNKMYPDSSK